MGTRAQLIAWAQGQLGTVGGSKYWQDVKGWGGGGLPWCAIFCSDALQQTGTPCAYFPSAVAFDTRDKAVIGRAWVDRYGLEAGDMLAFDWDGDGGGDHVGIVEKVLGNGVYQTIEGNVSNAVGRRTRYASSIIGGIRPEYEEDNPVAFSDVFKSTPHAEDIKWMKDMGISKGYSDGTYRPNAPLTRADAAAFLHRLYELLKQ